MDIARIHAENSVRLKILKAKYLRKSARDNSESRRVSSAVRARDLADADLEKVFSRIGNLEQHFGSYDAYKKWDNKVLKRSKEEIANTSGPEAAVDSLLQKIAAEVLQKSQLAIPTFLKFPIHSGYCRLELNIGLPSGPQASSGPQVSQEQNELNQHLDRLRRFE